LRNRVLSHAAIRGADRERRAGAPPRNRALIFNDRLDAVLTSFFR
jgi:hypothetical protein